MFHLSSRAKRLMLPLVLVAGAATLAPAQPATPPLLAAIDRIGIVFTDLEPDVGAGTPTVTGAVEWIEGPFYTPTFPGPSGEVEYVSHLTIAVSLPDFHRWDGPPHLLPDYLPEDVNRDGVVDQADFIAVISAWGRSIEDVALPPQ